VLFELDGGRDIEVSGVGSPVRDFGAMVGIIDAATGAELDAVEHLWHKSFVSDIVNSVGVLVVVINKDGLGNFDSDYQGCKVHRCVLLQ
jgi:hypothetical protein